MRYTISMAIDRNNRGAGTDRSKSRQNMKNKGQRYKNSAFEVSGSWRKYV